MRAGFGVRSSFVLVAFRLLELHSPDGQHTVVLRCKDGPSASSWFTAIHTNIAALLPHTLAHINAYLGASSAAPTHPHLKHIGWLAEQVHFCEMQSVVRLGPGNVLHTRPSDVVR